LGGALKAGRRVASCSRLKNHLLEVAQGKDDPSGGVLTVCFGLRKGKASVLLLLTVRGPCEGEKPSENYANPGKGSVKERSRLLS